MKSPDGELTSALTGLTALVLAADTYRLAAARYFQLDLVDTHAISYLDEHGPMTQARLSALMGISTGGITGLIDRLERGGTVRRVPDPHDRRRNRLELTERSHAILEESKRGLLRSFDVLDPTDVAVLAETLPKLAAELTREAKALRP